MKMKEVTDRLGVFLLPKERVIVVSAEQSGAVQFFLITCEDTCHHILRGSTW